MENIDLRIAQEAKMEKIQEIAKLLRILNYMVTIKQR